MAKNSDIALEAQRRLAGGVATGLNRVRPCKPQRGVGKTLRTFSARNAISAQPAATPQANLQSPFRAFHYNG
jgi:hypothetical protein